MIETAPPPIRLAPEDEARAYHYALVSRLFFGPPDRPLAEHLAGLATGDGETALARTRQALRQACETADLSAVRAEYEELFIGVGKSPVTLYTSHYAASQAPDRHLLTLRQRLCALGLARGVQVVETEDHISGMCDAMRWLIESEQAIGEQRRFFESFLAPAGGALCDAVANAPSSRFYKLVAELAAVFFQLEHEAFAMSV